MKDLRVDLATFQGPLDLLLYLVQQEEVDIHAVTISHIADRFLEVCRVGDRVARHCDSCGSAADSGVVTTRDALLVSCHVDSLTIPLVVTSVQ